MKLMEKGELSWTPCDDTRPHKFLPEMLFLKSILNTMALRGRCHNRIGSNCIVTKLGC